MFSIEIFNVVDVSHFHIHINMLHFAPLKYFSVRLRPSLCHFSVCFERLRDRQSVLPTLLIIRKMLKYEVGPI